MKQTLSSLSCEEGGGGGGVGVGKPHHLVLTRLVDKAMHPRLMIEGKQAGGETSKLGVFLRGGKGGGGGWKNIPRNSDQWHSILRMNRT